MVVVIVGRYRFESKGHLSLGSNNLGYKTNLTKTKTSDGKYAELVERLEGALDTRVTIAGSNTGGKIVIEYADGQDLQRIVGVIS